MFGGAYGLLGIYSKKFWNGEYVGNGDLFKIWKDKWLPTHTFFAIQSPRKILGEDVIVVEIIDKDKRWLNVSSSHEVFQKDETPQYVNCHSVFVIRDSERWAHLEMHFGHRVLS
jgi:hypothetical protein